MKSKKIEKNEKGFSKMILYYAKIGNVTSFFAFMANMVYL